MKIRNGFVSNSSSSSFCILGIVLNQEQCKFAEEKINRKCKVVELVSGIDEYYDDLLAGAYPSSMKDDETLAQFKDRIIEEMNSIGLDVKVSNLEWHTDGGHD